MISIIANHSFEIQITTCKTENYPYMKVEVFYQGQSMGIVNVTDLEYLERYQLRWLTHSIQMIIKFETLQEQIFWYEEVTDMIECIQAAQESSYFAAWKVSILRFNQTVDTLEKQVA